MALKDSLMQTILKTNQAQNSSARYKRLRVFDHPTEDIEALTGVQEVIQPLAKHEQSVSKEAVNAIATQKHSVIEPLAKDGQARGPMPMKREQRVSQSVSNIVNKTLTTQKQNIRPVDADNFEELVGTEKRLLAFIFKNCEERGALETTIITTEELRNHLKITADHLRNLIYRLTKKEVIKVSRLKNGRAGWRVFSLSRELYQNLRLNQGASNKHEQTVSNAPPKALAEPLASLSSSSSYNNIINKTTTTGATNGLSDEWSALDIQPLRGIGFTQNHLEQIAQQGKLSSEIVQDSIHAFAFDLMVNQKAKYIKGSPINFFMGIVRNGKPYAPPDNYESPQDREMRIYLERKRQIENQRAAREDELMKLAFAEWEREQREEDKQALLSEEVRISKLQGPKQAALRTYFAREVWPEERKKIMKNLGDNKC